MIIQWKKTENFTVFGRSESFRGTLHYNLQGFENFAWRICLFFSLKFGGHPCKIGINGRSFGHQLALMKRSISIPVLIVGSLALAAGPGLGPHSSRDHPRAEGWTAPPVERVGSFAGDVRGRSLGGATPGPINLADSPGVCVRDGAGGDIRLDWSDGARG